jgi:hypothetical protein
MSNVSHLEITLCHNFCLVIIESNQILQSSNKKKNKKIKKDIRDRGQRTGGTKRNFLCDLKFRLRTLVLYGAMRSPYL